MLNSLSLQMYFHFIPFSTKYLAYFTNTNTGTPLFYTAVHFSISLSQFFLITIFYTLTYGVFQHFYTLIHLFSAVVYEVCNDKHSNIWVITFEYTYVLYNNNNNNSSYIEGNNSSDSLSLIDKRLRDTNTNILTSNILSCSSLCHSLCYYCVSSSTESIFFHTNTHTQAQAHIGECSSIHT